MGRPISRAFWIAIVGVVWLAESGHNMRAEQRQVWKVAYRLAPNEYDGERKGWNYVFTAFSPDGKTIAAAYGNGLVRLYKTTDGALLHTLRGHDGVIRQPQFSSDGRRLLTHGLDGEVRLWLAPEGRQIVRLEMPPMPVWNEGDRSIPHRACSAELSPDGQAILTIMLKHPGTVFIWTADATGKFTPLEALSLESDHSSAETTRFSPDGKTAAVAADFNVFAFDRTSRRATGRTSLEESQVWPRPFPWDEVANVETAAFSPDGKRFCVRTSPENYTRSNGIMVFDTENWKSSFHWKIDGRVEGFSWSPDSRSIAVVGAPFLSEDRTPVVIDAESGRVVRQLQSPALAPLERVAVYSVSFSSDGRYILGGLPSYNQCIFSGSWLPRGYFIWDARTGKVVARLEGDVAGARANFSPDGKHIVNWSPQPTVWRLVE